jgi:hypothetical protein
MSFEDICTYGLFSNCLELERRGVLTRATQFDKLDWTVGLVSQPRQLEG